MKKPKLPKFKPASGFSHLLHLGLVILLPLLLYVLINVGLESLAFAAVLLSKWRMFAVRPRHWPAIFRANGVDILAGMSAVVFMAESDTQAMQLVWVALYSVWLVWLKPKSGVFAVSLQAMVCQLAALIALYIGWEDVPRSVLVLATGIICYLAARHFLSSFDEPLSRFIAYVWAYFGAALAWVLGHWLLFYGVVAQPTLLLTVIGYSLAAMYYLDHNDRLTTMLRRQFIFLMTAIIIVVLVFSDWGDKTI